MYIDIVLNENSCVYKMCAKSIFRFTSEVLGSYHRRNWLVSYLLPKMTHKCCTWVGRLLAVDSAETVPVDRLTKDVGGLGLGKETVKGLAVISEPELEKGRRAEPLSTGPHQGQAPAVHFLSCVTSLCYYNYLASLLFG